MLKILINFTETMLKVFKKNSKITLPNLMKISN
jgi:hypothetical protein